MVAALQLIGGSSSTSQGQAQSQSSRPRIDQSIRGTTYDNETSKFVLTVPEGWTVASPTGDLNFFGGLQDKRTSAAIILQHISVPATKSGAAAMEAHLNRAADYRKLSEGPMKIDGKDAYSLSFHALFVIGATGQRHQQPAQVLIVLIPGEGTTLEFMCETPENFAATLMPTMQAIVGSFRAKKP